MTHEHDPKKLARQTLIDYGHYPDLSARSEQSMLWASKEGPSEVVGAYLQFGMDPDIRDDWSRATPLIKAAEGDHPDMVRMLAEMGADLNARDKDGDTALHTAINWDNMDVFEALLEVESPLDTVNNAGQSPLGSALEGRKDGVIDKLLEAGASCDPCGPEHNPPLFVAADNYPEALERLFEAGADPNAKRPRDGRTLLMVAAAGGRRELAEAVFAAGADVDVTNEHGATAWTLAAWKGHARVADWLEEQGATPTDTQHFDMLRSALDGEFSLLEAYLDDSGDPELTTPEGVSLLESAVYAARADIVELLLEAGARPFDDGGRSRALMHASYDNQAEVVRLLLDAGADVDTTDDFEQTPVFQAVTYDSLEALDVLIEAGADLEVRKAFGESPLLYAVEWGKREIIDKLLAAGADVNGTNDNNESALHLAAKKHYTGVSETIYHELTEALLDAGADPMCVSYLGHTPVVHARFSKNDAATRIISDHLTIDRLAETRQRLGLGNSARGPEVYEALANSETAETLCEWIRRRERQIVLGLIEAGVVSRIEPAPNVDPLKEAAEEGDAEIVAALCEAGAPCEIVSQYGYSPLFQAIVGGHLEVLDVLIEAGVDLDVRLDNRPPIVVAAGPHLAIVERLVEAGCEVDPLPAGSSPLILAAAKGCEELVDWLLARDVRLDTRDTRRRTALHHAVDEGYASIVETLCEAGADLEVESLDGLTPLVSAAKDGKAGIARILLEAGADPGRADADGVSARDYAAGRKELAAVFAELAPAGDGGALPEINQPVDEAAWPTLLEAAYLGDQPRLVELCSQGADPDALNYRGDSALMVAIKRGSVEMIRALLEAGASVERTNDADQSALSLALTKSHPPGLKELLEEHGAKMAMEAIEGQVGVMQGQSDFLNALGSGDLVSAARRLDEHAVDIHLLSDGRTPLGAALQRGDTEMVELLLQKGAHPGVPHYNRAPLTWALDAGEEAAQLVYEALVARDATHSIARALIGAAVDDDARRVERLLALGVDPDVRDSAGHCALDEATAIGADSAARVLREAGAEGTENA
jgi:uncharacterized protein